MDAMKSALQKKMADMKGKGTPAPDAKDEAQEETQEMAPSLQAKADKGMSDKLPSAPSDDAQKMDILKALGGDKGPQGKAPGSLADKVGMAAKAKMDSMKKK